MINMQKKDFLDCLDTLQVINKPARENLGEDSFYCAQNGTSAIISVYDGCGGLGARKYDSFKEHTGAYIASRMVSGAVHDWYNNNYEKVWEQSKELTSSIDTYIREAYKICEKYGVERLKIKGSMVRKFPTTLALVYAENEKKGIRIHVLWAGDSRAYILDEDGLAQITKDDTDVDDALENLINDGAMTNVLSSDGNYRINYRTLHLDKPAIVFVATDGCFGYIPSPMEFEYAIVESLVSSDTPELFEKDLLAKLSEYAGDDLAMGLMSFFYGDFFNTRKAYLNRFTYLKNEYISVLEEDQSDECVLKLWEKYKPKYERYLKDTISKKEEFNE